jgi:hypothetical protein
MITEMQQERTKREWSAIAGEAINIEQIGSTIYAYGSELATLRLFRKMPSMRQGFSANFETFFFCVDLS